jgi:hypothetical protein
VHRRVAVGEWLAEPYERVEGEDAADVAPQRVGDHLAGGRLLRHRRRRHQVRRPRRLGTQCPHVLGNELAPLGARFAQQRLDAVEHLGAAVDPLDLDLSERQHGLLILDYAHRVVGDLSQYTMIPVLNFIGVTDGVYDGGDFHRRPAVVRGHEAE